MGVLVQVRDVPVTVHRVLKARAALAGTSLSEYLRQELEEISRRPTREELLARVLERERTAEGRSRPRIPCARFASRAELAPGS